MSVCECVRRGHCPWGGVGGGGGEERERERGRYSGRHSRRSVEIMYD